MNERERQRETRGTNIRYWKLKTKIPKEINIKRSEISISLEKTKQTKTNKNEIPDLIGKSNLDAISIVQKLGLNFKIIGEGRVIKQSIKAGTRIKEGELIILEFSWKKLRTYCIRSPLKL